MKWTGMKCILSIILLVVVLMTAGCVQSGSTQSKVVPTPVVTSCENKCNDICFDPSKQTCCFGKILDGSWREESSNRSCMNLNFASTNISYYEWYCGGARYHSNEDIGCCNGTIYYYSTMHCCQGKMKNGAGTYPNCGDSCYNPNWESCCNGVVCNSAGKECCNGTCCNGNCCNGTCCNGMCCGGICIDLDTQVCYKNTVYVKEGNDRVCGITLCDYGMKCCDTLEGAICYNPNTQECVSRWHKPYATFSAGR